MQARDAAQLRKEWGNKPCDHPKWEREYDLGAQTGDYVCTTCGKVEWEGDFKKMQQAKGER